jgi:AmmeMemoRadiSam system protein A
MLTPEEKRALLDIARAAIEAGFRTMPHTGFAGEAEVEASTTSSEPPTGHGQSEPPTEGLLKHQGAFVTIRLGGQLRGCIGYIESPVPLMTVVAEVAEKAAFEDPRFPPLSGLEYQNSTIEISVLSELKPLGSPEEFQVGVHGLLIESGDHRGLLLPQVALEHGWDRDGFLSALARKAGLSTIVWDDPLTKLYTFQAEIVQEEGAATHA